MRSSCVANCSVMPAWLLLAVAPRWEWTRRIVHSLLYPAALGSLYTVYAAAVVPRPGGARGRRASERSPAW